MYRIIGIAFSVFFSVLFIFNGIKNIKGYGLREIFNKDELIEITDYKHEKKILKFFSIANFVCAAVVFLVAISLYVDKLNNSKMIWIFYTVLTVVISINSIVKIICVHPNYKFKNTVIYLVQLLFIIFCFCINPSYNFTYDKVMREYSYKIEVKGFDQNFVEEIEKGNTKEVSEGDISNLQKTDERVEFYNESGKYLAEATVFIGDINSKNIKNIKIYKLFNTYFYYVK